MAPGSRLGYAEPQVQHYAASGPPYQYDTTRLAAQQPFAQTQPYPSVTQLQHQPNMPREQSPNRPPQQFTQTQPQIQPTYGYGRSDPSARTQGQSPYHERITQAMSHLASQGGEAKSELEVFELMRQSSGRGTFHDFGASTAVVSSQPLALDGQDGRPPASFFSYLRQPEETAPVGTKPEVQAEAVTWPFLMCGSSIHDVCYDTPVCCYAACCPLCLHAEMQMKVDGGHCCSHFWMDVLATGLITPVVYSTLALAGCCLCGHFLTPCIGFRTAYFRHHLTDLHKHLDTIECICPCCAHVFCLPCALFQEAVFVKQNYGDFTCCYYSCCQTMCSTSTTLDQRELKGTQRPQKNSLQADQIQLHRVLQERVQSGQLANRPMVLAHQPNRRPVDDSFFLPLGR